MQIEPKPNDPGPAFWLCPSCDQTVRSADRYRYPAPIGEVGHLAKHCGCSVRMNKKMTAQEFEAHTRQRTIELKRKYRREAGAVSRADRAAMAAAKRVALSEARAATQLHDAHVAKWLARLPDAHVRRHLQVMKDRIKAKRAHQTAPQNVRARAMKRRQSLNDSYVIQNLKAMGHPEQAITEQIIALKRESMEYRRLSRNMKSTLKQHLEQENETLAKHT